MLKVLLLEDNEIWQIKLQLMIEELGYQVVVASSLTEMNIILEKEIVDVIFADIHLPDGYSTDYFLSKPIRCPIIFVTEIAEKNFVNQVLSIPFATFFVKPFHSLTLFAALQSAISNFKAAQSIKNDTKVLTLPIRYNHTTDVPISSILYITVEGNYSSVKTLERQYVQKLSFAKLTPYLDERFIQVHKSVIINKEFISHVNFNKNTITIQGQTFSIGRSFRKSLMESIYKVKTKE